MRVGMVRTDLGRGVFIADVESRSLSNLAGNPPGQTRNVRRPTNTEWERVLALYPLPVAVTGTDMAVTVDTTVNNTLRIRTGGSSVYTVIVVTIGAATPKTTIVTNLNAGFTAAGLLLSASVVGTNQIRITSTGANTGPYAFFQIDSVANGSTLNTSVGFPVGGTSASGITFAALQALLQTAVYPTSTTINVSTANIIAVSTINLLSVPNQTALVAAIAELVAPTFIETGAVLLSFSGGVISRIRSATFRPDGDRAGYATGLAVAVVAADGVTPF